MRKIIVILTIVLSSARVFSQSIDVERYLTDHYEARMKQFYLDKVKQYDIVFLGNSITERGNWQDEFVKYSIANRGIGGDNTFGVLARVDEVLKLSPKKIFLMIGINDIGQGTSVEAIFNNINTIVKKIVSKNEDVQIYIQSVLPVNPNLTTYTVGRKEDLSRLNLLLSECLVNIKNVVFVDTYSLFVDLNGNLGVQYTTDGVHLNEQAYQMLYSYFNENRFFD